MRNDLKLGPKANAQSRTLSGGMKRKLSVGIALSAGSKVSVWWPTMVTSFFIIKKQKRKVKNKETKTKSKNYCFLWVKILFAVNHKRRELHRPAFYYVQKL